MLTRYMTLPYAARLLGIALLELGVLRRNGNTEGKLKLHATFVAMFLVVAHIAMIFGMLNPAVLRAGGIAGM